MSDNIRDVLARNLVLMISMLVTAMALPGCSGSPVEKSQQPNVVYLLTDDLSMDLLPYMPNVRQLAADGATFSNYVVADSLCCPSRASIFTGKFPHNTGIFTNSGDDGGWKKFHSSGAEKSTFATAAQSAGYITGFFGKYLNEYEPQTSSGDPNRAWVPPGWSQWGAVDDRGYDGYGYKIADNDKIEQYGDGPGDYFTTVAKNKGVDFVTAHAGSPFLLEIAVFAPHWPTTPAPQDVNSYPDLRAPRSPDYGTLPSDPPGWLGIYPALDARTQAQTDRTFAMRVRAVQEVDRMVGELRQALSSAGIADSTYVVFNSDNGFHTGQHRLAGGKQTAFDHDVRTPLIVAGPGITKGRVIDQAVQNTDLAPTFADIAGRSLGPDIDGRTLLPLLHGQPDSWKTLALVEHHGQSDKLYNPTDPDLSVSLNEYGNTIPPTYDALRSAAFTYVEYPAGDYEYYDNVNDPSQIRNIYASLSDARRRELHDQLNALRTCQGVDSCWAAARPAQS